MSDRVPDLRVLAVGLAQAVQARWPDLVTLQDVARLEDAQDVLLVGMRVLAQVAERAGLTREETNAIVKRALEVKPQETSRVALLEVETVEVRRIPRFMELLSQLDQASLQRESRERLPGWFTDSYYPGLLRRVASGGHVTSRDESILVSILEKASGRRW